MTFKNKKEEVIEIELTSFGKHLLSKGKFKPYYYAFFDDDVVYDSRYAGTTEEQNYSQTRILEETPTTRVQVNYAGVETEIKAQIEAARAANKTVRETFQSTKEKNYSLSSPLGRSSVSSDLSPSWDITMHGAQFTKVFAVKEKTGELHQLPIPQMHMGVLNYELCVFGPDDYDFKLDESVFTGHTEDIQRYQAVYDNGNSVRIKHKDVVVEVDELHTDSLRENYDIEIFLAEEETVVRDGQSVKIETLVPLKFMKGLEDNVKNGLLLDDQEITQQTDPDENYVEYYLDLDIDTDISKSMLCELGYVTDYSKRGHIKVTCGDEKEESRMNRIYTPFSDPVEPFGDDCE